MSNSQDRRRRKFAAFTGRHHGWDEAVLLKFARVRPEGPLQSEEVRVTNSEFPRYVAIDAKLERVADSAVRRSGDRFVFRPANGRARYRLVDRLPNRGLYVLESGTVG